jgi:hypothetical protein
LFALADYYAQGVPIVARLAKNSLKALWIKGLTHATIFQACDREHVPRCLRLFCTNSSLSGCRFESNSGSERQITHIARTEISERASAQRRKSPPAEIRMAGQEPEETGVFLANLPVPL